MSILFISSLVPDNPNYWSSAFTRSGQNVVRGIACSLREHVANVELVSCKPLPSFPKGPLFIKSGSDVLDDGQNIHFLPTINLLFLKNIVWGVSALLYILKWSRKHPNKSRTVLVYNIYVPLISSLYRACKLTKSKLYAILYDLGVPPATLNLSVIKMFGYKQYEKLAHKFIPKLDGRIVINENIVKEYAPSCDYILIDGGVNDIFIKTLFPLRISDNNTVTYVLAGMLWEQNGTRILLEAIKLKPYLNLKVIFAGQGNDVPLIIETSKNDPRVEYVGMLSIDELMKYYEQADILLNLRVEEDNDMHFPSKLLEYMSVGKWVISTPVAHAPRDYGNYLDILYDYTPEGLAQKMEELSCLSKKQMYDFGMQARNYILRYRTWDTRTKEIIQYINK